MTLRLCGTAVFRLRLSKVFRLSKNTFLGNFSFIVNWKWNFSSFFYGKQTFLAPKLIISAWARVSENWQSAADYRKCSSLGSELTTFNDGILSKLLFQLVKKRFNLHSLFISNKIKKYNLIYNVLKTSFFHNFCRVCPSGKCYNKS